MAVRTAYAPVAGAVLTAANLAKLAGGWIGFVQVTASQTGIGAETDLTSLTLSVTVGTGRKIRITGYGQVTGTSASSTYIFSVYEGAARLVGAQGTNSSTATSPTAVTTSVIVDATPGAHTYKLRLAFVGGAGTVGLSAAADQPAYILVEDLGSTP